MAYQAEIEKLEARFREKPEQWFAALADAYRKAGDVDMALEVLGAWIDKRPNYTSGHIVRGRCYLDKQLDAEAASAFENVLSLDMENVIALKSLSEIAERRGDTGGARQWLGRLLEVDPMNEEAQAALEKIGAGAQPAPALEPLPVEPEAVEVSEAEGFEPTAAVVDEVAAARDSVAVDGRVDVMEEEPQPSERPVEPVKLEPEAYAPAAAEPPAAKVEEAEEAVAEVARAGPAFELDTGPEAEVEPMVAPPAAEAEGLPELVETSAERELAEIQAEADEFEAADRKIETTLPEPIEAIRIPEPEPRVTEAAEAKAPEAPELAHGYRTDESRVPTEEQLLPEAQFIEPPAPEPSEAVAKAPAIQPEPEEQALPLIVPEGVSAQPEVEEPAEVGADVGTPEPEPVVTETMAELYFSQGHLDQARDIYRKLVAARPDDRRLSARLADLDAQKERARPRPAPAVADRFAAAATGGKSVRELMQELLGQQRAAVTTATEKAEAEVAKAPAAPAPNAAKPERPKAQDQPPASAPPQGPPAGRGFSFDEFFGGGSAPDANASSESPPPSASSPRAQGNEEFRSWLKGLKT